MPTTAPSCTVVVPVKRTTIAKSRLSSLGEPARRELALAFACDTVAAAAAAAVVRRVLVVTDDDVGRELIRLGAEVVPDLPDAGLNPALAYAAGIAQSDDPTTTVLAMSADLPALRPSDLELVWSLRSGARWFVPDSYGDGTTVLAAAPAVALEPAFGPGSRARHLESGAREVIAVGLERLRHDVDTEHDLAVVRALGVGRHTAGALSATVDRRPA